MSDMEWLRCPIYGNKTRLKILKNAELRNFPSYCPKCRQDTLINIKQQNVSIVRRTKNRWQRHYWHSCSRYKSLYDQLK